MSNFYEKMIYTVINVVVNFIKMAKPKMVFRYICSGCNNTISETTNTVIYHSKLSFDVWSNIIDNLLNGFSLRRIAEENNISVLTSFRIRHKVLLALTTFINNIKLSGEIQSDEKYFSINLKGTKKKYAKIFKEKNINKISILWNKSS